MGRAELARTLRRGAPGRSRSGPSRARAGVAAARPVMLRCGSTGGSWFPRLDGVAQARVDDSDAVAGLQLGRRADLDFAGGNLVRDDGGRVVPPFLHAVVADGGAAA